MDTIAVIDTPRNMHIALTGRCNLRCEYCFYANEMVGLRDLPTESWLTIFEKLSAIGLMSVSLTGGEVFTRRDLFELIDGLVANRMRYTLLTNGTLITEDILRAFDVGKRRQRLNIIQVSIDGSRAEIHDRSRPKSFDRALRGLRLLVDAGFPVTVRMTLNQYNYRDLENTVQLLLDDVGVPTMSTNEAMALGSGCDNQGDLALTALQRLELMDTFRSLLEHYPNRLLAQAGPQAKLKFYAEMEAARRTGERADGWQMGTLSACGCTFVELGIMHDGTIIPCHLLPNLILGNILTDSICDIWHNHPILHQMRNRRSIPTNSVSGCEMCDWNAYCNGSCPALPYEMTGDMNQINPQDCYRRFLAETEAQHV